VFGRKARPRSPEGEASYEEAPETQVSAGD